MPSLFREVECAPLPVAELLAASQWGVRSRGVRDIVLDMRYAPDEDMLLNPTPRSVWARVTRAAPDCAAELATHYAVADPYGAERGASVISGFFSIPLSPAQLTFGAGVTPLLHGLARLAGHGVVAAPALVHSDLEVWAASQGATIRIFDAAAPWDQIAAAMHRQRPAVLHLDRPAFAGDVMPLVLVARLVDAAVDAGTIVIVDEAPATYLGPRASVARLVSTMDNLVVVRGFTKAYSMGGMRAAFALASRNIASRVRDVIAPLQISELSLTVALRLLGEGDMVARLADRIRAMKPDVVALFRSAGFAVIDAHPDLPWIAMRDDDGAAARRLESLGIRPLLPTTAIAFPAAYRVNPILRVTIPLSVTRMECLRGLLDTSVAPAGAR